MAASGAVAHDIMGSFMNIEMDDHAKVRAGKIASVVVGLIAIGLGMAFKAGSDDPRESLSYKLRKILLMKAQATLCTDPYVVDERFVSLDEVLARADLLVIAAPHADYRGLVTDKPVADMWGVTGRGMAI